jgi:hypothetical protein
MPSVILIYPSPSFYLEVRPPPLTYVPAPVHPEPAGGFDREALRSRILGRSRDVLKELVPPRLVGAYRERKLKALRNSRPADWIWNSVPEDRMAILDQHLKALLPVVQATGARIFLVTHTTRFAGASPELIARDHRHLVNLQAVYYPQASDHVMIAVDSAANTLVRRNAAAFNTGVLEVEGRIPPGGEYFADYAHFTDAGADRMAHLLAADLLRQLAVPGLDSSTSSHQ